MDTQAIAAEIVQLKNRIAELDADNADERKRLRDRMGQLQDLLADKGERDKHAPDSRVDKVQFIAPA